MSITSSTILGARLRLRSSAGKGAQLGFIKRMLVEPGKAQLAVLVVQRGRLFGTRFCVEARNLEAVRGRLYVSGENMSVDTVDSEWIKLEGLAVYTKSGVYLGHIEDVYYDPMNFMVTQLEVAKRVVFMPIMRLLIGREDIIDITKKHVIVQDAVMEEVDGVPAVLQKTTTLQPQQSAHLASKR